MPQSTIRFGRPALKRDDPDYIASVVAAHVLGGSGSMTSRLFREVREKRGLAYTVFGTFYALEHGAYFYGGTTTKNERARESLDVAAAEIRDVALNGLNDEELEKGKTYLIGSYPLRFDTSAKIASQLVHIQLERRAPEWLVERNRQIAAVTIGERAPRRASRLRRRLAAYDCGREAGGVLSASDPPKISARDSLERRHAFRDHMEGLLVERVDRHLRSAVQARIVQRSDLQDHHRQVRPAGREMGAAILAEFARHRPIEIAAGEALGRAAHVAEALGRHQHEHVRRAAADVLAFAAVTLRFEARFAVGHVTHFPTIASALECHPWSSEGGHLSRGVTPSKASAFPALPPMR